MIFFLHNTEKLSYAMTTKWSFLEEIKWANKVFFLTAKGAFPPFPKLLSQAHKRKVRKPLLISPRDQLTTLNLKFTFLKESQIVPVRFLTNSRNLFLIASEASYVYILKSGQKFIKNGKCSQFWRFFENLKLSVKQRFQKGHC